MNVSSRFPQQIAAPAPPRWLAVSRGAALGLGLLFTLNFLEILHLNSSTAENWFCSLSPLPDRLGLVVLAMAVPSFLLFAVRPGVPGPVRNALLLIIALFAACSARDCREIFIAVPESTLIAACSRPLSVILPLLATAAGLLLGTQRRRSGNSSLATFLGIAAITAAGFPLACIQTDATLRPIPDIPLLIVPETITGPLDTTKLPQIAATTANVWKLHHESRILLYLPASPEKSNPPLEQILKHFTDAGVPREAIITSQTAGNSPAVLFETLRSRPEIKKSTPVQLAFAGQGFRLARVKLLARRYGLKPLLIPVGTDVATTQNPIEISRECWFLLKSMAEPANEYLKSLRPPSETQLPDSQPSDETIDPEQLLRELQDSSATDP